LIVVVKEGGRIIGSIFSKLLSHPPFNDPLRKCDTMSKWKEQCWQLVIHVSMTVFEYHILSDETWWNETITCWIPHPKTQQVKSSLRLFYYVQLAIWAYTAFSHRFY